MGKVAFPLPQTITASFGYKTATSSYVIKSFSYIIRTCGYSLSYTLNKFSPYAKEVGMSEYLDHEPTRLSGGQKQRVAIAGILSMKPEILILDEATSMLDPEGKEDINNLVKQLHKENNMTILSITHDVEEVLKSDHVIVMYEGRIVKDGTPSEVMKNEEELVRLKLAAPYSVRLANELKKLGIPVKQAWDMEGMVDELCQLLLNK